LSGDSSFSVARISRHRNRRAAAYIPQIDSPGQRTLFGWNSRDAYALSCVASILFLIHVAMIRDVVFAFVQIVNLTAILAIVICVKKYERQMYLTHLHEIHTRQR